jgi:hypothetical protein
MRLATWGVTLTVLSCSSMPQRAEVCGPGTHDEAGVCVANGTGTGSDAGARDAGTTVQCGPGTQQQGGLCVSTVNAYQVRLPVTEVPADGFSVSPVLSIGQLGDGRPATDAVVLKVVPATAGTVGPASFQLDPLGSTSWFNPCNSTAPTCTGSFQLELALASAPNVTIASSGTLTLVPPTGVGSPAPCLVSGNVVFFNGDPGDYIFNSMTTITQGTWSSNASPSDVTVHVTPMSSSQGLWWDLEFSTTHLSQPLAVGVYRMAERAPFASPGHPGIDLGGDGRGCNTITGAFQVHSLRWADDAGLSDFLATFEQHCEGGPAALRGCVHFAQ